MSAKKKLLSRPIYIAILTIWVLALIVAFGWCRSEAAERSCVTEELVSPWRVGVAQYCDIQDPVTPNTLTIMFRENGDIDPLQTYIEANGVVTSGPNFIDVEGNELGEMFWQLSDAVGSNALPSCNHNSLFPFSCTAFASGACGMYWWGGPKAVFVQRVVGSEVVTCRYQCEGGDVEYYSCRHTDPDPVPQPDPCTCAGEPTCDCGP